MHSQRRAGDTFFKPIWNSFVVQLVARQTSMSQGLVPRQLRKRRHAKQIGATQGAHSCIAAMAMDDKWGDCLLIGQPALHFTEAARAASCRICPS
jgi:hypothetical protein